MRILGAILGVLFILWCFYIIYHTTVTDIGEDADKEMENEIQRKENSQGK